jgi:hypothetical protein
MAVLIAYAWVSAQIPCIRLCPGEWDRMCRVGLSFEHLSWRRPVCTVVLVFKDFCSSCYLDQPWKESYCAGLSQGCWPLLLVVMLDNQVQQEFQIQWPFHWVQDPGTVRRSLSVRPMKNEVSLGHGEICQNSLHHPLPSPRDCWTCFCRGKLEGQCLYRGCQRGYQSLGVSLRFMWSVQAALEPISGNFLSFPQSLE